MTLTTFEKIKKIAGMAVASGVAYRSLLTTMIDLDKAVKIYDLDLDALMAANIVDFANEIRDIQINIDRSTETFPDYYTPKFARKKKVT